MTDYEKYLKYKTKYLQLKKLNEQLGGVYSININPTFETIRNSGARDGYTNACMWISIQDYLKYVLGQNVPLKDIRDIGLVKPEEKYTMFDTDISRHYNGLQNIARRYNLKIVIFSLMDNGQLLPYGQTINEQGQHEVRIISFGAHFELLFKSIGYRLPVNSRRPTTSSNVTSSTGSKESKFSYGELSSKIGTPSKVYSQIDKTYIDIQEIDLELQSLEFIIRDLLTSEQSTAELDELLQRQTKLIDYKKTYKSILKKSMVKSDDKKSIEKKNAHIKKQIRVKTNELQRIKNTLKRLQSQPQTATIVGRIMKNLNIVDILATEIESLQLQLQ